MKTVFMIAVPMVLLPGVSACSRGDRPTQPLQEGVIWTLQWTDGAGESHGSSRASVPESVPGGSGSWNMDLYGRLYSTHIEITNRQANNMGPKIILVDKLDFVQFGDGGRVFKEAR